MKWYWFILWAKDYTGAWKRSAEYGPAMLDTRAAADDMAWKFRSQNYDFTSPLSVYQYDAGRKTWVLLKDPTNWGRGSTEVR